MVLFNLPAHAGFSENAVPEVFSKQEIIVLQSEFHDDLSVCSLQKLTGIADQPRQLFKKFLFHRKSKNKKLIAALLAFPFPFGIVGLHRIYLGTSPHVPIVYIATIGGGFGLLPLIDFIVILSSPDIEQYINNQQVFMWKQ